MKTVKFSPVQVALCILFLFCSCQKLYAASLQGNELSEVLKKVCAASVIFNEVYTAFKNLAVNSVIK